MSLHLQTVLKKPSYLLLAKWVEIAWMSLDPNLIKRSFKCCGISDAIVISNANT